MIYCNCVPVCLSVCVCQTEHKYAVPCSINTNKLMTGITYCHLYNNERGYYPANSEMARVLVSHGAHVNLHGGSDSWTPLFYAAMAGKVILQAVCLSVLSIDIF